ncbi:DENN domain-containing protein 10 [Tribolium castaneum]|uniref:Protein FAM45A-like Protein n=1 Tax=Tribolium castaneum TaxID=7070 RepID=D6X0K6_TRICA|nr:PREDICTED: protein FAM45A [Tribolium castaneum]EFA10011.2 Protein FAM45A-like Protein [Tribolium castaneum]|eukprot:XP_008197591.1 PREDICTED: protein FAM45A [Tribolium castaneum]
MTYIDKLISFHIVENENRKNFLSWTYPTITVDHEKYILSNCFARGVQNEYFCGRVQNNWIYISQFVSSKTFAIVIAAKEFEPNKYRQLCDILGKKYAKSQNPVDLVTLYLNLFTSGSCSLQENGASFVCNFKNYESVANLKEFIASFDLEIILLYSAILLKRRILLFDNNMELLLSELLAISNLVPLRKVADYLYPVIESSNKLKGLSFYVAGTTNSDLIRDEHLYDLFVNLRTREITVSPKAEEIMAMTKTHKDIATFLVKLSASDLPETQVKQQILQKTKELLSLLKSLASVTTDNHVKMVTMNDLRAKKYHPNLENFLFNLAVSENMMIL